MVQVLKAVAVIVKPSTAIKFRGVHYPAGQIEISYDEHLLRAFP